MLKRVFVLLFVIISLHTVAFASGDVLADNDFLESNISGESVIVKNSKYSDTEKTFQGTVIKAGYRYEEDDGWSTTVTPYQDVKIRIQEDDYEEIVTVKYQLSYYDGSNVPADELKVGDKVYVTILFDEAGRIIQTYVPYISNERYVVTMIVLYAGAIILIGGLKGIRALIGLIITIAAVFGVMVPLIFEGDPPLRVTILTCIGVISITFLIVSGFSKKTIAASLGTAGGIIVAGIFATIFGNLMKLTGACNHAMQLSMLDPESSFNFENIMISGVIVGALGACMDVGMSIASALHELSVEGDGMTVRKLINSGFNIGKDVMGTMTNTLILAYIGSSLLVVLLLKGFEFETYQIINNTELVLEEVLRAISGSFGLVVTIPITTLVSALLMGKPNDFNQMLLNGDRDVTYTKKGV